MNLLIFAEGTDQENTDPERTKKSFSRLWETLIAKCGEHAEPPSRYQVTVKGFSKKAITRMTGRMMGELQGPYKIGADPTDIVHLERPPIELSQSLPTLSLDQIIADEYDSRFDKTIIALDLEPKNNNLAKRCRNAEIYLLLECLGKSDKLPKHLSKSAERLKQWYYHNWHEEERLPKRGPWFDLEILVMSPCFEILLVEDPKGLSRALGHKQEPDGWREIFQKKTNNPDRDQFIPACKTAYWLKPTLQDPTCGDKHAWAEYVLRHYEGKKLWTHEIFRRLQKLLAAANAPATV